jgi:glucose uptake protein
VAAALTLGTFGSTGPSALASLGEAGASAIGAAVLSGALFNLSNILLVVAIDSAGMAVAFPVGVGLALVIGTVASYLQAPKGNAVLLFAGVALIVVAMLASSAAYRKLPRQRSSSTRGLLFAVLAGCLMGFFYPQLSRAISPGFASGNMEAGRLTPYAALALFGAGLVASNFVLNTIFMRAGKLTYGDYFHGTLRLHSLGIAGGIIWMAALSANVLAAGVAGPAISYALGQGATLVAAIWGVVVWREFRDAPAGTAGWIAAMFIAYVAGIAMIGAATL